MKKIRPVILLLAGSLALATGSVAEANSEGSAWSLRDLFRSRNDEGACSRKQEVTNGCYSDLKARPIRCVCR